MSLFKKQIVIIGGSKASKEQLKAAAKELREEFNKVKSLTKLHSDRIVSARVKGIINQGLVLEKRLDHILAKAKEQNVSVNLSAEIGAFSEKIIAAKDKYLQAEAKLSEALDLRVKGEPADSDKIKSLIGDADELLKEARNAIREAHDILKVIVKKIKEAIPDSDISADVEVEIES